ncbi:MAG: glycine cleavage system protein GcvH [Oligoflexales bacterium]|nr:glycine cleavage system protein GcvH [Oligoflexales bacterium]
MQLPAHLHYTKDHEWISKPSGTAKVGVSAYAIEQLGDIVHIELPAVGSSIEARDSFGTIESTKTVSDLYMPVGGKIKAVNEEVLRSPHLLHEDPYEKGWLIEVELSPNSKKETLLSADQYESYIQEEG